MHLLFRVGDNELGQFEEVAAKRGFDVFRLEEVRFLLGNSSQRLVVGHVVVALLGHYPKKT